MNVLTTYEDRNAVTVVASYVLAGLALYLSLKLHLLAGVLAGLLVYELVTLLAPRLEKRFAGERARLVAVATLVVVAIGEITQQPRYYDYISRLAPPDQQGTYETETVSFGAVRLKIIDLEHGQQPMHSDDGDVTP